MENPGTLKWRTWSHAQKGFVAGALFGFLATLILYGIGLGLLGDTGEGGLLNVFAFVVGWAGIFASIPGYLLLKALGLRTVFSLEDLSPVVIAINAITNAFVLGFVGAVVGLGTRFAQRQMQSKKRSV